MRIQSQKKLNWYIFLVRNVPILFLAHFIACSAAFFLAIISPYFYWSLHISRMVVLVSRKR